MNDNYQRVYKELQELPKNGHSEYMSKFKELSDIFWKEITLPGQDLSEEVLNELADYYFLMEQSWKIYSEVTGGRLSAKLYFAESVIAAYEEDVQKREAEAIMMNLEHIAYNIGISGEKFREFKTVDEATKYILSVVEPTNKETNSEGGETSSD